MTVEGVDLSSPKSFVYNKKRHYAHTPHTKDWGRVLVGDVASSCPKAPKVETDVELPQFMNRTKGKRHLGDIEEAFPPVLISTQAAGPRRLFGANEGPEPPRHTPRHHHLHASEHGFGERLSNFTECTPDGCSFTSTVSPRRLRAGPSTPPSGEGSSRRNKVRRTRGEVEPPVAKEKTRTGRKLISAANFTPSDDADLVAQRSHRRWLATPPTVRKARKDLEDRKVHIGPPETARKPKTHELAEMAKLPSARLERLAHLKQEGEGEWEAHAHKSQTARASQKDMTERIAGEEQRWRESRAKALSLGFRTTGQPDPTPISMSQDPKLKGATFLVDNISAVVRGGRDGDGTERQPAPIPPDVVRRLRPTPPFATDPN